MNFASNAKVIAQAEVEQLQQSGEPTSMVLKRPQGWEEEGILFPHEGIRFLMEELCEAVRVMDPEPSWKWDNLATWYQDYFYDVVHHHHDTEEQLYFPWLQERVTIPPKITADHPELMRALDELRDMIMAGAKASTGERGECLAQLRNRTRALAEDMGQHLAEEEEIIPGLIRDGGFTHEEEKLVVGKIIQSLGLDGNKKSLPLMVHALTRWAGEEKAEAFVANLPLPIRFLYRQLWWPDFVQRHRGLIASLPEGVDTNPFAYRLCFCYRPRRISNRSTSGLQTAVALPRLLQRSNITHVQGRPTKSESTE